MKDYSLGAKKDFILYYKIENDQIIPILAGNKEGDKIPYTKENEDEMLKTMDSQIQEKPQNLYNLTIYTKYVKISLRSFYSFSKTKRTLGLMKKVCVFALSGFGGIFCGVLLADITLKLMYDKVMILICYALTIIGSISYTVLFARLKLIEKDIVKTEFFKENEQLLNEHIPKGNAEVLSNVSKKTIATVKEKQLKNNDRPVFDINSIHRMSLKDLKTIRENIDCILGGNILEPSITSGRPYVRRREKPKNNLKK